MIQFDNLVAQAIERHFSQDERARAKVGPSMAVAIDQCRRKAWCSMRSLAHELHSPRMRNLFGMGHSEEVRLLDAMASGGAEVFRLNKKGKQLKVKHPEYEHIHGAIDALARFEPNGELVLIDPKTCSAKNWRAYVKHGPSKFSGYITQQNTYLGLMRESWDDFVKQAPKLKGTRPPEKFVLLFVNKDTSDIHTHQGSFDQASYDALIKDALGLIEDHDLPPRLPSDCFTCKWCAMRGTCWEGEPLRKACGSCNHYSYIAQKCTKLGFGCLASAAACTSYSAIEVQDDDSGFDVFDFGSF